MLSSSLPGNPVRHQQEPCVYIHLGIHPDIGALATTAESHLSNLLLLPTSSLTRYLIMYHGRTPSRTQPITIADPKLSCGTCQSRVLPHRSSLPPGKRPLSRAVRARTSSWFEHQPHYKDNCRGVVLSFISALSSTSSPLNSRP